MNRPYGRSIYPGPELSLVLKRFQRDHPEVSISKLCVNFLAQYLYDQGYHVTEERETNP